MNRPRFLLVLVVAVSFVHVVRSVDKTLVDDSTGSEVVQAVIAKLDVTKIFDSDHRLLRRLAFVESSDGTNSSTGTQGGGIWGLERSKLDIILNATELAEMRNKISVNFGVVWTQVTEDDLRKPFYAGMAARMYLFYLEATQFANIPLAGNIKAQAQFWVSYYHSNVGGLTVDYFIEKVTLLEEIEGCKVNTDIFFMLDGSGSIGSSNFEQVRQFEIEFVNNLIIGPKDNQVGTIVFSNVGSIAFYLNSYSNRNDVVGAIQTIPYPGGSTNTPDGLCQMVRHGFTEINGARPTSAAVFRVAIVMTDGKSNLESSECQWNTLQAAEAVHALSPPVLVYVIGVTGNINQQELEDIATSPDYITRLTSFNRDILQETQEEHIDEVCKTASVPADVEEEMNGTLDGNETIRYHFPIPVIGITVEVCVSQGHILVYGSVTVPNPNSAFYDWVFELNYEHMHHNNESVACQNQFFDPSTIPDKDRPDTIWASSTVITSSQVMQTPQPSMAPGSGFDHKTVELTDKILYLSIVGRQNENNFVLNGTVGDVYHEGDDSDSPVTTTPVITPVTTPITTPTPNGTTHSVNDITDEKLLILVAASSSGLLLLLLLCMFILCCACCCCVRCLKKKRGEVYQYNLLPRNTDYI